MGALPRRTVLAGALTGAVTGLLHSTTDPSCAESAGRWFAGALRRAATPDPFTLGVASGDPAPDGVVLWTRLAPDPAAEDGYGGMPDRAVDVDWEIAEDDGFTRVVRRGTETAVREHAHSVHAEPAGLAPGRDYFYRFRCDGHLSPTARTRTAPAVGAAVPALTVAATSCAKFGAGYFTAYRGIASDAPDLIVHLGDYFYEADDGDVRDPGPPEPEDLRGYRRTHAHQRSDADLRAAHAAAPWVVVWDDHEVVNNWDARTSPDRRRDAARAYYEHMPLRRTSVPDGPEMCLHRSLAWGDLATLHVLDTRQYRGGGSMLGAEQERWLLGGLRDSTAGWDVLAQQVYFAPRRGGKSGTWDEFPGSRDRVVRGWAEAGVRNAVVLTGDEHVHHANEIPGPDDRIAGTELVTTSVTSGGDGDGESHDRAGSSVWSTDRRGYLLARFTPAELRAEFRTVAGVGEPGAEVTTAASFVVPDREPGLHRV